MRGLHRPTQAEIKARVAAGRRWMLNQADDLDGFVGVTVAPPNEPDDDTEPDTAELAAIKKLYNNLSPVERREFTNWRWLYELRVAEERSRTIEEKQYVDTN